MARTRRPRLLTGIAVVATLVVLGAAGALAQSQRRTTLLSVPASQRAADGPSANAAVSQDERAVRLAAFDSAASNLVASDGNGQRDVFVLHRGSKLGELDGRLELASVASNGEQGNAESRRPSVDGEGRVAPRCVAFESRATNLHPGDATDDFDVFVRDLHRNTTTLASVGAPDGAVNATVDGRCEVVTFEAGGRVWIRHLRGRRTSLVGTGTDPDMQTDGEGAAYVRGHHVVYRPFTLSRAGRLDRGRERVVSRGPSRAGNAQSANPVMDNHGHYVAFESRATNLCGRGDRWCHGVNRDGNGQTSDVFRATLSSRAPTRDRMQMVSYSHGAGGGVRAQGNADSQNPAMSGAGEFVFFDSRATNLRESTGREPEEARDGDLDVFLWNFPRRRGYGSVARESRPGSGGEFEADSYLPATSNRGNYIAFESLYGGSDVNADRGFSGGADVLIRFLGGR